jgi:hypothetical protein
MSDWQQDPGTTAVMPPATGGAPPTAPPSGGGPKPGGRGLPWWVAAIIVLVAVLLAGGGVYMFAAGRAAGLERQLADLESANAALEQKLTDLATQVASSEASLAAATAAAEAAKTTAGTTAGSTTTKVTTEKQFTYIKKVTWSSSKGYQLVADYAQLLTGKAAADAATAHGDESPPPNDYYILNDNALLRTFVIPKTATVIVLNFGTGDATKKTTISVDQFMDIMPGGTNPQEPWISAPYYITITGGAVTRVEQYYLP